jgi:hypothetical protein
MDTHTMVMIIIENKPPLYALSTASVTMSLTIFLTFLTLSSIIRFTPNIFIVSDERSPVSREEPQRYPAVAREQSACCDTSTAVARGHVDVPDGGNKDV